MFTLKRWLDSQRSTAFFYIYLHFEYQDDDNKYQQYADYEYFVTHAQLGLDREIESKNGIFEKIKICYKSYKRRYVR